MRHVGVPGAVLLSLVLLLPLLGGLPGGAGPNSAEARDATEARTAGEVYERRETIEACLEFVAGDLKVRNDARKTKDAPALMLVVDPTVSMRREIAVLQKQIPTLWRHGPRNLKIGVVGAGSERVQAPTLVSREVNGALEALAYVSNNAPKNLHIAIRRAAEVLEEAGDAPKAILLMTEDGGEVEDDVEATRAALFDADCAFYCIAPEAAFEWPWTQPFEGRPQWMAAGFEERLTPDERKAPKGSVFFGSEVAYGLVPYRWEYNLAQSDFIWVRPPRYPVPSGFGYWSLATLSFSTGGRYFVFDFRAAAAAAQGRQRAKPRYNFSRMGQLAPDLRPRKKVLKSLGRDFRAQAIVRIWQSLADEAVPIIQVRGTLERRGTRLLPRPRRPILSAENPLLWMTDMDEVRERVSRAEERIRRLDQALVVWSKANARERKQRAGENALAERLEANFQLLGVQLKQVRFQWGEVRAALKDIKPLDVSYRQVRVLPRRLLTGFQEPNSFLLPETPERKALLADFRLSQQKLAERFQGTPWSLIMDKATVYGFVKEVQIIEPEPERPTRPERPPGQGNGGQAGKPPAAAPKPRPKPPPGPKPGSGGDGPTTGG